MQTGTSEQPDAENAHAVAVVAPELDREEFEQIAAHLRSLYRAGAFQTAIAIGEYVAERFFDGNTQRLASAGKVHPSIRRLAKHGNLGFSAATLWTALAVTEQARQLPAELGPALSLEHHRLLVAVRDPDQKAALARAAVDEVLGKRALATRIAEAQRQHPRKEKRGRKAGSRRLAALAVVESPQKAMAAPLGPVAASTVAGVEDDDGQDGPVWQDQSEASPGAAHARPQEVLALLATARQTTGVPQTRFQPSKPMASAMDLASAMSAVEDAVQQFFDWKQASDFGSLNAGEWQDLARRASACSDQLDDFADDVRVTVEEPA